MADPQVWRRLAPRAGSEGAGDSGPQPGLSRTAGAPALSHRAAPGLEARLADPRRRREANERGHRLPASSAVRCSAGSSAFSQKPRPTRRRPGRPNLLAMT